jgi:hypothetical protein
MSPDHVNNGSRVDLPFAAGPAGLVVNGDDALLSFVRGRGAPPRTGATIDIEGEAWTVTASKPSTFVKGMVVLTLARAVTDD